MIVIRPAWYFTKLARWGKGFFNPDFEAMKNEADHWRIHYSDGFFAYNQLGGKIRYYFLMIYFVLFVSFILFILLLIIYSIIYSLVL